MTYTVFARKYRPQSFDELVGQEAVATTIRGAIRQDRVAHAFLFTGVRGVGKTTTARLLAKCLNCEAGDSPREEPCNQCESCLRITQGNDVDVLEIDGASNNSVEDVRRLQESVPFRPARARFKVYIIDEVHMLSTGAFNALLKTLEEPPPHVKFIFATTEVQKVPVTIRSRCQSYDFRLVPGPVIAERLAFILGKEDMSATPEALATLAREADGSMRDALTLLDQVVAAGEKHLDLKTVRDSLGLADWSVMESTLKALVHRDALPIFGAMESLSHFGANLQHFMKELLRWSRDLVYLSVTHEESLSHRSSEENNFAKDLVQSAPKVDLQRIFSGLAKLVDEIHLSREPHLAAEMGLVRLASRTALVELETLLQELGGNSSDSGPQGPGPQGPGPQNTSGTRAASRTQSTSTAQTPVHRAAPEAPAPRAATASLPSQPATDLQANQPNQANRRSEHPVGAGTQQPKHPATQPRPEPPTSPAKIEEEVPGPSPLATRPISWEQLIDALAQREPAIAAILEHAIPLELGSEKLVLGYENSSFFASQANSAETKSAIVAEAERCFGLQPRIEIRTGASGEPAAAQSLHKQKQARIQVEEETTRAEALAHPTVRSLLDVFPVRPDSLEVTLHLR